MKKKIVLVSNVTIMAQEALSNHYEEVQRIDTLGNGYIDGESYYNKYSNFEDKPEYKYFEKPKSKYHK